MKQVITKVLVAGLAVVAFGALIGIGMKIPDAASSGISKMWPDEWPDKLKISRLWTFEPKVDPYEILKRHTPDELTGKSRILPDCLWDFSGNFSPPRQIKYDSDSRSWTARKGGDGCDQVEQWVIDAETGEVVHTTGLRPSGGEPSYWRKTIPTPSYQNPSPNWRPPTPSPTMTSEEREYWCANMSDSLKKLLGECK